MATLAQLRARISRKIKDPNNTGTSASAINDEINRAIRFYRNYRFWFNEELLDITLTTGVQVVPNVPATLISELQVNGLLLIDDQVKIDLDKLSPSDFRESDDDQTGRPYYYTFIDGSFLLLPTPDRAYTLRLRYLESYADLVNDSDTNDFTDNAEDLIMLHCLKNLYAEDKDDPTYAVRFAELESAELRTLRERSGNLLSNGTLKVHSIL